MRPIPSSILEKINKFRQTQAENADPKINLIMQRTRRYIEQGSLLQPSDLWERADLGPLDIAYRRESRMTGPDKVYLVYIEGGEAHVAWIDYIKSIEEVNEWEYLHTIGPAVDVAIEFDGHWVRTSPDAEVCFDAPAQWTLVTTGEPYFFRVLSGSLVVQQGQGAPTELVSSGVSRVAALRSWENVYRWNHDHGLIAAYIRNNTVRYRNYANQGTEANPLPPVWELEREVTELPSPAQSVALFRTNDYRTGILAEAAGEIHWTITERNWAGMAIRDHTVIVRGIGLLADLLAIDYRDAYLPDHTISVTGANVAAMLCPPGLPQVIEICNPGPEETESIRIECDMELFGDLTGLQAAFTVTDEALQGFSVLTTEKMNGNIIKLTTDDFETAVGDLTVNYTHSLGPIFAQVEGGCLMELESFSESFTPDIAPPEGFTKHTITMAGTELNIDFIVVHYVNELTEHTITVAGVDIFIDFIHVDDIPP